MFAKMVKLIIAFLCLAAVTGTQSRPLELDEAELDLLARELMHDKELVDWLLNYEEKAAEQTTTATLPPATTTLPPTTTTLPPTTTLAPTTTTQPPTTTTQPPTTTTQPPTTTNLPPTTTTLAPSTTVEEDQQGGGLSEFSFTELCNLFNALFVSNRDLFKRENSLAVYKIYLVCQLPEPGAGPTEDDLAAQLAADFTSQQLLKDALGSSKGSGRPAPAAAAGSDSDSDEEDDDEVPPVAAGEQQEGQGDVAPESSSADKWKVLAGALNQAQEEEEAESNPQPAGNTAGENGTGQVVRDSLSLLSDRREEKKEDQRLTEREMLELELRLFHLLGENQ